MRTTISAKGRITIPAEGALLRKAARGEHPADRVFGILRPGSGVAILSELRDGSGLSAKASKSKR